MLKEKVYVIRSHLLKEKKMEDGEELIGVQSKEKQHLSDLFFPNFMKQ